MITKGMHPLEELRKENARVMHALVMAMRAAQCWHDVKEAADVIIEVELCRFGPLLREAERRSSDGGGVILGAVAQQEHE